MTMRDVGRLRDRYAIAGIGLSRFGKPRIAQVDPTGV